MSQDKSGKSKKHRQHQHWKEEEDELLLSLVLKYNAKKWKLVAAEMSTRNAKQCRERYFGHLEEGIDKHPLSKEEDALILQLRKEPVDNGWARIAAVINKTFNLKRTPNQIKNNYNQRLSKLLNIEELQTQTLKTHEYYGFSKEQTETNGFQNDSTEQFPTLNGFSKEQTESVGIHKGSVEQFSTLKYEITEITEITKQLTSQKLKSLEKSKSNKRHQPYYRKPKDNQINRMSITYLMNPISST